MNACLISINICVAVHHSAIVTLLILAKNCMHLNWICLQCVYMLSVWINHRRSLKLCLSNWNCNAFKMESNDNLLVRASSTSQAAQQIPKITFTLTHNSTNRFTLHSITTISTLLHLSSPLLFHTLLFTVLQSIDPFIALSVLTSHQFK